jgi:hypothetical protein
MHVSAEGSCRFAGIGVTRKIVSLKHPMKKEAQIRPDTYPSSILAAERFQTEVEFLDVIGTKVLRVFLLAIVQTNFTPSRLEQKWFETGL